MSTQRHPKRSSPRRSVLNRAAWQTLSALMLSPALAQAQTPDGASGSTPGTALDTVVITASPQAQRLKEAPASISVIQRADIERSAARTLTDVLKGVEGLSVVGADPNDLDISLRGMPGEYTLLMVNGQRQNTRETMNRSTAGVQSQLLPPLDAIERIEIVRGPMSSIYGADAIGGVVNVITRKIPRRWMGSATLGAVWQQDSDLGGSRNLGFWTGGPLLDGRVGLQLTGQVQQRDEDHIYYPASLTGGTAGRSIPSLSARLSARLDSRQDLTLDLGREQFTTTTTPGVSDGPVTPARASRTVTRSRYTRDHWGLTHTGQWGVGSSEILLYGEKGQQQTWTAVGPSTVEPVIGNTVLEARWKMPWGAQEQHFLTLGVQKTWSTLTGAASQDAVPSGYDANPDRISRDAWALYAENRYSVTPALNLTSGLRLDTDSRYGSHVSPRLYAVYQVAPHWTMRGGVAGGFKPPTLRQSTPGYCMTTGGVAGATPGTLCGNGQLKAESSLSQELGLRYDAGAGDSAVFAAATLFHSVFRNKVASYDSGVADPKAPGRNIYVYDNIDRVRIQGLELSAGAPLARGLSGTASYTLTRSERQGSGEKAFNGSSLDGLPLDKTPEHALTGRLNWQATPAAALFTQMNYSGRQTWAAFRNGALAPRVRGGSTTWDVGGSYRFSPIWRLNVALDNLTDRRVAVDDRSRNDGLSGNWMVDEGRRLAVSLNGTF